MSVYGVTAAVSLIVHVYAWKAMRIGNEAIIVGFECLGLRARKRRDASCDHVDCQCVWCRCGGYGMGACVR